MTEEIKTQEPKEEPQAEETTERMVPVSALQKQAADYKAQLDELQKFKAEYEAGQRKAEEEEMKKREEFDKLLSKKDGELEELRRSLSERDRRIVEGMAKDKLRAMGLQDDLRIRGALVDLPADATADTVEQWATEFKSANPGAFETGPTPVRQPSAGSPDSGSTTASVAQLKADLADPSKAAKAAREIEARILRGDAI